MTHRPTHPRMVCGVCGRDLVVDRVVRCPEDGHPFMAKAEFRAQYRAIEDGPAPPSPWVNPLKPILFEHPRTENRPRVSGVAYERVPQRLTRVVLYRDRLEARYDAPTFSDAARRPDERQYDPHSGILDVLCAPCSKAIGVVVEGNAPGAYLVIVEGRDGMLSDATVDRSSPRHLPVTCRHHADVALDRDEVLREAEIARGSTKARPVYARAR